MLAIVSLTLFHLFESTIIHLGHGVLVHADLLPIVDNLITSSPFDEEKYHGKRSNSEYNDFTTF